MAKKTKKVRRFNREMSNCPGGCREATIQVVGVQNGINNNKKQRYECSKCGRRMDIGQNDNLIGNPFDIVERRDSHKDTELLNSIKFEHPYGPPYWFVGRHWSGTIISSTNLPKSW